MTMPMTMPMTMSNVSLIEEMATYKSRLKTFEVGWKLNYITPEQMAKAGFYFLGIQNHVRCAICSETFSKWKPGDDPLIKHRNRNPQCLFFQKQKGPLQKDIATLDGRLKTFSKCMITLKYDIHTLCEAGFYYNGDGLNDHMITFCCNLILEDLEIDDDPLEKHSNWLPNCSYLLLYNETNRIDVASGIQSETKIINQGILSKRIPDNKDFPSVKNTSIDDKLIQRKSFLGEMAEIQHQVPDSSKLCNVCLREPKMIYFMPCGHGSPCCRCTRSFKTCHVCGEVCDMITDLPDRKDTVTQTLHNQLPRSSQFEMPSRTTRNNLLTSEPVVGVFTGSLPEPTALSSGNSTLDMNDMTVYNNRIRTFNIGWKLSYISPEQMAKAGFYFLGKRDIVKCTFCSREFDYWTLGEDPIVEHRKKSPQCPFLKRNHGHDLQPIEHYYYRDVASLAGRLKSFDRCMITLKHDITSLCEAGFYYTGDGQNDHMMTFCCKLNLKELENDDEPWTEHIAWSPKCWYVVVWKKSGRINEVSGMINGTQKIKQEASLTEIPNSENTNTVNNHNIREFLVEVSKDHFETQWLDINSSISLQDSKVMDLQKQSIDGSLLCKKCYKEEITTVLIPCGHITICSKCALLSKHCPTCSQPFTITSRVSIRKVKKINNYLDDVELAYYGEHILNNFNRIDEFRSNWSTRSTPNFIPLSPTTPPPFFNNAPDSSMVSPRRLMMANSLSESLHRTNTTWDMTIYENRLKTFNVGWKLDFITPDQMSRAGFYFLGRQDDVRCTFCCNEFSYWNRDEIPLIEHREKFPHCPYFLQSQAYDLIQLNDPKYKHLERFETRLRTFQKYLKRLREEGTFCAAGFFYIGDGQSDEMVCFCCGINLSHWMTSDEPWTEHARWSPNCNYLILCRGKKFIEQALGVPPEVRRLDQVTLSEILNNATALANSNERSINTRRELNVPVTTENRIAPLVPKSNSNSLEEPNATSALNDSLLCKICYKENICMAFIPCGHVITCADCAKTIDLCAICRDRFKVAMNVTVCTSKGEDNDDGNPQSSSEPLDPVVCKVCSINEMSTVFLPCNHIYACEKCTIGMRQCPSCLKEIVSSKSVYL